MQRGFHRFRRRERAAQSVRVSLDRMSVARQHRWTADPCSGQIDPYASQTDHSGPRGGNPITGGTPPGSSCSSSNTWQVIKSPDGSASAATSVLTGVSGTSPSDIWAVGSYTAPYAQTLIEHSKWLTVDDGAEPRRSRLASGPTQRRSGDIDNGCLGRWGLCACVGWRLANAHRALGW